MLLQLAIDVPKVSELGDIPHHRIHWTHWIHRRWSGLTPYPTVSTQGIGSHSLLRISSSQCLKSVPQTVTPTSAAILGSSSGISTSRSLSSSCTPAAAAFALASSCARSLALPTSSVLLGWSCRLQVDPAAAKSAMPPNQKQQTLCKVGIAAISSILKAANSPIFDDLSTDIARKSFAVGALRSAMTIRCTHCDLVAAVHLDESLCTLRTLAHESLGHCFFDCMTVVETVICFDLCVFSFDREATHLHKSLGCGPANN